MKHVDLVPAIGNAQTEEMMAMQCPVSIRRFGDASVACYRNEIPAFAQREMTRLYGCEYASLEHLRIYGGTQGASTYVEWNDAGIVNVLLFRIEGTRGSMAHVLNEMIAVDAITASRFSRYVFHSWPSVQCIVFNAIRPAFARLPFPYQCVNHSEDFVVALPATRDEYLARFGKATRKNLRRHLHRAKRGLPEFRFEVIAGEAIQEQDLRKIAALNHARMALQGKVSYVDEAETRRLLRLARECGFISVIRVEGRICAGSIYARFGDNFFSQVNAHDPAYDDWRLGILCCYLTICDCIDRGGREFHMLWGRLPYKAMMQGVQVDLARLAIYRSRFAMLRHAVPVMRNAGFAVTRTAKYWLLEQERQNHPAWRLLVGLLRRWRNTGAPQPAHQPAGSKEDTC